MNTVVLWILGILGAILVLFLLLGTIATLKKVKRPLVKRSDEDGESEKGERRGKEPKVSPKKPESGNVWKFLRFVVGWGVAVILCLLVLKFYKESLAASDKRAHPTEIYVSLLGRDVPSEEVVTPPGTTYRYWGPDSTYVLYFDGTWVPITANVGVKRGIFCFFGPQGDSVRVVWWDKRG